MGCNTKKITSCFLKGNDYKDRTVTFHDGVTGLVAYRYEIKAVLGEVVKTLTENEGLEILGNQIVIVSDFFEDLPTGNYTATFHYERNGQRTRLYDEQMKITNEPCDCATDYDLSFHLIPVTIDEQIVNVYLNYDQLTEQQKADLRFDYEDFTPDNIAVLQLPAIEAAAIANQSAANADRAAEFATAATQGAVEATGQAIAGASTATSAAAVANTAAQTTQAVANETVVVKNETLDVKEQTLNLFNHPPIIQNDNWWNWNGTQYVDTGKKAKGEIGSVAVIQAANEADAIAKSAANPGNVYFWI